MIIDENYSVMIHVHLKLGNVPFVIPCKLSELFLYALSDIREEATIMARSHPDREVHWSLASGLFLIDPKPIR